MNWASKSIIYVLLSLMLSACLTTSETRAPDLSEILKDERVITFPLVKTSFGRWVIDMGIGDTDMATMLIDTGATYSAIMDHAAKRLSIQPTDGSVVRIHGLATSGDTPVATLDRVRFGQDEYLKKSFALLPAKESYVADELEIDGVLGMDIMSHYRLYINIADARIYFIPNIFPDVMKPDGYNSIALFRNPYSEIAPELHFFALYVKSSSVPALLDTGTDISLMNWHAANFAEAKTIKAVLKSKWKIAGAIGEFKPVSRAKFSQIDARNFRWKDIEILIEDTESLEILGVNDKPFIVAGIAFLSGRDIYMDFQNNRLWLQRDVEAAIEFSDPE